MGLEVNREEYMEFLQYNKVSLGPREKLLDELERLSKEDPKFDIILDLNWGCPRYGPGSIIIDFAPPEEA
jgi:hypothetical protein